MIWHLGTSLLKVWKMYACNQKLTLWISFWIQKLIHNVSFWIQKLMLNVSFWTKKIWIQKLLLWISFWTQKLTKNISFWIQKLTFFVSFFSGSRNWHYGSVSGSRNWHYGRGELYGKLKEYKYKQSLMFWKDLERSRIGIWIRNERKKNRKTEFSTCRSRAYLVSTGQKE